MKMINRRLIALLLCVVCAASVLSGCTGGSPDPTGTSSSSTPGNTVPQQAESTPTTDATWPPVVSTFEPYDWASMYSILYYDQYYAMFDPYDEMTVHPGEVYISEFLLEYLSIGTDASQVYPVLVYEMTGESIPKRKDVYQNVIQHLDVVYEAYMDCSTIYVTQDQLLAIEWPEEYGFVLGVGHVSAEVYPVINEFTKEALENVDANYIPVNICFEFPVALAPQDLEYEQERIARECGLQLELSGKNPYWVFTFATPEQLIDLLDDPYLVEIEYMAFSDWYNGDYFI